MKTLKTILLIIVISINANYGQKQIEGLEKTTSEHVTSTYLNTNNISTTIYNNGECDVRSLYAAFEFPKGSNKYAIYQSGLVWGAFVGSDTLPKIGGSTYLTALEPGKILADGTPDDPSLPKNRIYRVRADVFPGGPIANLSIEIEDEKDSYENIRNRYENDWNEWPASDGAPFIDKDLNGIYDPLVDLPGVKNAAQTLWYVANDLSELDSNYFAPVAYKLGVEVQVTMWAYQSEPLFGNSHFRKYKLINKSQNEFKEMYISQWNDPDLGYQGDDFVGTDTISSMIYVYNADDFDNNYGNKLPAVGFQLLQGPIVVGNSGEDRNKNGVDDAADFAIYENNLRGPGFINLPMTASYSPREHITPRIGEAGGTKAWYLFFQGKDGNFTGKTYVDPNTGIETTYPLSGDPVTQTGWVDGQVFPPGDRRMGFASGPFNLAVGDTQEVVIAALAEMGADRLESISLLRYYADEIQRLYKNNSFPEKLPTPQSPDLKINNSIDGIILDWGSNSDLVSEIENFNSEGYKFQGYNVYRGMVSKSGLAFYSKAAVFDIVDGVTTIYGEFRDSITGLPTQGIKQQGNNSGIERSIIFDKDNESDTPLLKGKDYSFGVSAYTYNENPTNGISTSETPIHYFNITYLNALPGANFGDQIEFVHNSGNGDGDKIEIHVVDAAKLTGDDYEIFFTKVDSLSGDTKKYWNMRNINFNDTVLSNQTVMNGIDIYTNEVSENPIADGLKINVNVEYEMPTTFSKLFLYAWEIERNSSARSFQIDDFTIFGEPDARSINSNLGLGTSDSSILLKDYEIRFNGTLSTDIINDKPVQNIISGGQNATLYGANRYDLADHPMNPNPGSNEPFTIRVPFEVWSIDDNKQINLMVWDREGDPASTDTFQVWNKDGRMYTEFVMSDYHENIIDPEGEEVQNFATWNLVWWKSDWQNFNLLKFIYQNPATSNDKFTFTAPPKFNKEDFRIPESFELYHNYPNPFNPTTTIRFDLPEDNNVKLEVFNILGQKVSTLVNEFYKGGMHEVQFNSRGLASGVYIYRLEAGSHINVKKMVLLK